MASLHVPYGIRRFVDRARKEGVGPAAATTARRLRDRPLYTVRNRLDEARDKRLTGVSLEQCVAAVSEGAIDTISTPYGTLEQVLGRERFSAYDVLLDVGCGVGRPLAYLAGKRFPGRLVGIELNPQVAQAAQQWAVRYGNVSIVEGDAFQHDLTPYTAFFMWKAMVTDVFRRFILKLEAEVQRPVRVFSVGDQDDDDFMIGRPGWELRRRDWVSRVRGLPMHAVPTRFSCWVFDPAQARR